MNFTKDKHYLGDTRMVLRLYTNIEGLEKCYYVISKSLVGDEELQIITSLLSCFGRYQLHSSPSLDNYIEVGPLFSMESSESSIIVDILKSCGVVVNRVECSTLHPEGTDIWNYHDEMTSEVYPTDFDPATCFTRNSNTSPVSFICDSFDSFANDYHSILAKKGMLEEDIEVFGPWYISQKRIPTETEIFHIVNANSEHSRHGFFGSKLIIDGEPIDNTLFELIKYAYSIHQSNALIAFHDNASAVQGGSCKYFTPDNPLEYSLFRTKESILHLTINAETHNFPSTVEPYQGAMTGLGGMLRDSNCAGKGSYWGATFAGYAVDALSIELFNQNLRIPGDEPIINYPTTVASGIQKYLRSIAGVSDYGNCAGIPNIAGFSRSYSNIVDDQWYAYTKCILFAGGLGTIEEENITKDTAAKGQIVSQIGGPAYRIGFGGGLASSGIQQDSNAERDKNAVQRGNPEMGNRLKRVMHALADLQLVSIAHDQGAVGSCNAVTESIEDIGGEIDIRAINRGDTSLSVTEIWGVESQERNCIVYDLEHYDSISTICDREGLPLEVLGETQDNGKITVLDSCNPGNPVLDLPLDLLFHPSSQRTIKDNTIPVTGEILNYHDDIIFHLDNVLKQISVTHKGHIVYRKDRSVSGRTIQAQCVGVFDYPMSDYGIVSADQSGTLGQLIAIGEKPLMVLIDPEKGARMSFAEAVFNAAGVVYDNAHNVTNWMWPAKRPGQNAKLYHALNAISDCACKAAIPALGGKDSLSMITQDSSGEEIYSPPTVVISMSGRVLDHTKRVTTLLIDKPALISCIQFGNELKLGGSAFSQSIGNLGTPEDIPDITPLQIDNAKRLFNELVANDLILAIHDCIGDGGLITALVEMSAGSNVGMRVDVEEDEIIPFLFSETPRVVIQYDNDNYMKIRQLCYQYSGEFTIIGKTNSSHTFELYNYEDKIFDFTLGELRQKLMYSNLFLTAEFMRFNSGNYQLARDEYDLLGNDLPTLKYTLGYHNTLLDSDIVQSNPYKILIVRDQGSNGEVEMAYMFHLVGFEVVDVTMKDFDDMSSLTEYNGMIFVGGFSSKDVISSGVGWATKIKSNPHTVALFSAFFERTDTFVLGVCNGCQLMSYLLDMMIDELTPHTVQLNRNKSHVFESRTSKVRINDNPSILFQGMSNSVVSIVSAHGEGQFNFDQDGYDYFIENNLYPIQYVDYYHNHTEAYPCNPNGSPMGIAGLTSKCGRFTMMMPHPERSIQLFQIQDLELYPDNMEIGPWYQMAVNAYNWLKQQ